MTYKLWTPEEFEQPRKLHNPDQLYVDGRTIECNPSKVGGTWAARLVNWDGRIEWSASGKMTLGDIMLPLVTNNVMELVALVQGLNRLPYYWQGIVNSDSEITLGRAFDGWKQNGVPVWLSLALKREKERLIHWNQIEYVRLGAHPTKIELMQGFNSKGAPVSKHNVWCDQACKIK